MSEREIKLRIPPSSKEAEMMVIGCMLSSVNALNSAADTLEDTDFYYNEHRIIFSVLKQSWKQDKPADVHLIGEELKRQGKLEAIGGILYLTTLVQYAGTSAYIEYYNLLVKDKATLRKMIHASQDIEKKAFEEPSDVARALDEAQKLFFQIGQSSSQQTGKLIGEILSGAKADSQKSFLKELQERQEYFQIHGEKTAGIAGIRTHFTDLDKILNGFNNSNLMILAARPAMGKTALAINIAENICIKNKLPVGIFSLEMSAEQLVHRMVCGRAEVNSDKIKTGSLSGIEFQRIVACVNELTGHTILIDDQPGLVITDLRARARRIKESYGIGFLVIDYLQLITGSNSARVQESRQIEIAEISRMLKNLARELNIPILCLSQLSRKVEERQGHRPQMSDLRESGCLTGDTKIQDADTGQFYTIKELALRKEQTPINIIGIDKDLKLGQHKMVKAFYSGQKQVFEMRTRTGRCIKASANHPFLKLEGWTRLDALKEGDRIAIPRSLKLNSICSEIQDDELVLLGHLLGDGCILPNQPYHYTSADEENINTVVIVSRALFDIKSRVVKQKNWFHVYLPSPTRLTHGKRHPITNWFEKLGILRVRSYEKRIPSQFFNCDERQIAIFVKHLWATDGNLSIKRLKQRIDTGAIYYATSSRELSEQLQHLLLRLAIQSNLSKVPSKLEYRSMYHLHVYGAKNQKKFLTEVGCAGARGQVIPYLIEQIDTIKTNPNWDVIPKEAWQKVIKQAKDQQKLGWRAVCRGLNTSYCGSTLFKSGISRQRMASLHKILPTEDIQKLAESDVYWDEITSIKPLGVEDVYDATVENVHNFVANDIIVHNSIEQDSDVVMFLLRREYYDPSDKPGQAELIIAKNRHGPVGSVILTYRKEFAQFVNYTPMKFERDVEVDKETEDAFSHFSA